MAGVHWLADHTAGQKIGRAAAEAVIERLEQDGISPVNLMPLQCRRRLLNHLIHQAIPSR
jgi:hypothetical protein